MKAKVPPSPKPGMASAFSAKAAVKKPPAGGGHNVVGNSSLKTAVSHAKGKKYC